MGGWFTLVAGRVSISVARLRKLVPQRAQQRWWLHREQRRDSNGLRRLRVLHGQVERSRRHQQPQRQPRASEGWLLNAEVPHIFAVYKVYVENILLRRILISLGAML
eukprot:SAG11_NODE_1464_length_4862_cov_1.419064_1_plen_107_part_00